jgi:4-alpha-glucanotransferase
VASAPPYAGTLRALAAAHGVAAEYWDWLGRHVQVPERTLHAVLGALDIDTASEVSCRSALESRRLQPWKTMLPPYVVAHEGQTRTVDVHVVHGAGVDVWITHENGRHHANLRQLDNHREPRLVANRLIGEATFAVPSDLPPGYHTLHSFSDGSEQRASLIVAPRWLGMPERVGDHRFWGLAAQLYSARSRRSWGIGDLADLAALAAWSATEHGAGFVLVNPLHAGEPLPPLEPSPYLPTTRRFANPLYLRVEQIPEFAYLDASTRNEISRLASVAEGPQTLLDRDTAWSAKRAALLLVFRSGLDPGRRIAFEAFRRRAGFELQDFAIWCALSEDHGPDWHHWPVALRHPREPAVARFAATAADRVEFYSWLQWHLDAQLAEAQRTARDCGMALGIVHDLAVGVSPVGAESWAQQDAMAPDITVGAPPDAYAQTGQDWNQPPWRPDRLAELAYQPFRELVRSALGHGGGLRVDHAIGLFRLWWIPRDAGPTEGTYVRYDHEAHVAILTLEAARASAIVIGEDLGTVEPWVRDYLAEHGVFGTSVLWFENDWAAGGGPLPAERWREYCLASVTTHDLPPTSGYLAGDHVRLRHDLGLLTRPLDVELAADRAERVAWLNHLREKGLLAPEGATGSVHEGAAGNQGTGAKHAADESVMSADDTEAAVIALHRALDAAPSRLRLLALADAVGERRTQNQPGIAEGYPNWRVPLAGPDGKPILLEDVFVDPRAARLAEVMRSE